MKVREVTEAILAMNGGRKFEQTCDQLIEGNWDYQVNGVVTTFMATVDVIRRAIKMGCNLINTHDGSKPTLFTSLKKL